ncbi:MAG TPA: sulfotransferase [Steroidobacteraceae bacterium]|nr:sulfotransferase [Steroidobacteraceae bacterium]
MSNPIEPTPAAVRDAIARGDLAEAAKTLSDIVTNDRRADWAFINLIALLANHGRNTDALAVARRAIVANPGNAAAHDQLGTLLSLENDLPAGEWHFRRALETGGKNAGPLANLALNLMQQGRTAEAEAAFAEADRLAPKTLRILAHWSKLREVQGDFAGAERLLEAAEAASSAEAVSLLRVQYLARTGRDAEALSIIEAARNINGDGQLERGRLYERVGRPAKAWADYVEGKRKLAAELGGLSYDAAGVADFYRALREYFGAATMARIPRASTRGDVPQPVFILGAPRSGTTLIEQVLSAHSAVRAGGEHSWIGELRTVAERLCRYGGDFPGCLDSTAAADERHLAAVLRDHYFSRAETAGLTGPGARLFTDKTPFNEINLPLLLMAFPEAKLVLVKRDPRDVAVSMLSNNLSHGFNCAFRIEDIVRHLAATEALVADYRRKLEFAVHVLQYERFVADPEGETRRLLSHVGLPFEDACLRFHEGRRYAPTPSYARVAEKVNDRSVGRWRHFAGELAPHLAALGPVLTTGGYGP